MIYYLSSYLKFYWPLFGGMHSVGIRSVISFFSSFFISVLFGKIFLLYLQRFFQSKVRPDTPLLHHVKNNKPTMGGIFILASILCNILLWCDLWDSYVIIFIFCISGFAAIGFWDDWNKIHKTHGIDAATKLRVQVAVAICTVVALMTTHTFSPCIVIPLVHYQLYVGWFFIVWAVFVLVGCSNAVNLTDGLDGLATSCLLPNFTLLAGICYGASSALVAFYLNVPFTPTDQMAIVGTIIVGSLLGFLWYNTYPAQVFMGDVGSLALGSALGLLALMVKQELLLAVSGGVFVVETCSVIVQVASMKVRGTRIFKMAPIHHHFELIGWSEPAITTRCGIISVLLCVVALLIFRLS